MLRVECLGTVRARTAGHPLDLGGRRQRSVLAVLVAARGRTVAADTFAEEVWAGEPPPSASSALQAYVSRLRTLLEPERRPREPARVIVSSPPGYALALPDEAVDTWQVTSLVRRAGEADDAAAVGLVDEALGLWVDEPFAEFADEPWARDEVARLVGLRAHAVELRAAAALRLGRVAETVADLDLHVRRHPLRESGVALHARALYAAGRQADALAAIGDLRRRLDDELGVRPGPEVAALEVDVLAHAEHLRPPVPAAPVVLAPPPEAVPSDDSLVGRDDETARLLTAVRRVLASGRPGAVWVEGDAGIGKSALLDAVCDALLADDDPPRVVRARCPEVSGAPAGVLWDAVLPRPEGTDRLGYPLADAVTEAVGPGPVVVALEDLHRADDLSLQVLRHLVQTAEAPVAVLGTFRADEVGPHLTATLAVTVDRTAERLWLRGLPDDRARLLLRRNVTTPLPERVWRRLLDRAAGNPLFLRQLGRLVSAEGAAAGERLPHGVRELLRRRVERLPPATVEVLGRAAVLGRDVDVDVLVALEEEWSGLAEPEVLDHLDVGLVAGLLEVQTDGRLAFGHVLVRDTLEDTVPPLRRRRVHRTALEVLHRLRPDAVEQLARHASASLDARTAAAALPVLLEAAGRGDDAGAVRHLREALRALDLLGAPRAERTAVRLPLVAALARSGDTLAARSERAVAVAEARAGGSVLDVARAWAWPAPLLWSRRAAEDPAEAALVEIDDVLRQVLELPPGPERDALVVELRCAEALESDPGDTRRVVAASAAALEVADRLGDPLLVCRALNAAYLGTFAHPTDHLAGTATRLVEAARAARRLDYEAVGHFMLHSAALGEGDLGRARRHAQDALRVSTQGQLSEMLLVDAVLGATTALLDGDAEAARRRFEEVCAQITASGDPNGPQIELWARFSVEFVVGDTSGLLPRVRAMEPRLPVELNDLLVCALLDAGDTDAARAAWRPEDWQRDATWLFRTAVRAWIAVRLADTGVARRCHADLLPWSGQVVRTLNGALVLGPVDHYLGLLAPLVGVPPPAPAAGTPVGRLVPARRA